MIRTQIQLTDDQLSKLKAEAAGSGTSVAELIRRAVDRHLLATHAPMGRRERAIAAIGGFHSGLRDVGENHDDHLAQAFGE